jgi:hypothetical protein
MLVRPLIWRELLRECRHRSHFVGRTLFVAAVAGLIIFHWSQTRLFDAPVLQPRVWAAPPRGPSSALPLMSGLEWMKWRLARFGAQLFGFWALGQFVAMVALATFRSGTLADERRLNSLDVLRTTAVGDRGLLWGTFLSVLGRAGFVLLLGAPVLLVCRAFGGFTLLHVGAVTAVTLLAAAAACALTLALSAGAQSAGAAVGASLLVQAVWLWTTFGFAPFGLHVNALSAVVVLGAGRVGAASPFLILLVGCPLVALLGLRVAARLLQREPLRLGAALKRTFGAADRLFADGSRRRLVLWRGGLGPCRGNPILWRERAVSVMGQRDHALRLYYWLMAGVLCAALIWVMVSGSLEVLKVFALGGLVGAPFIVCVLLTLFMPGGTFGRERQQRTMPLLAATPLTARSIVLGKFLFCLRPAVVPLSVMLVLVPTMAVGGRLVLGSGVSWTMGCNFTLLSLLGLTPLVVALALFVGAAARTPAQGNAFALMLAVGALVFWHPTAARDAITGLAPPENHAILGVGVTIMAAVVLLRYQGRSMGLRAVLALLSLVAFRAGCSQAFLYLPQDDPERLMMFPGETPIFAVIGNLWTFIGTLLLSLAAAALFVSLTVRQLDGLLGRNG